MESDRPPTMLCNEGSVSSVAEYPLRNTSTGCETSISQNVSLTKYLLVLKRDYNFFLYTNLKLFNKMLLLHPFFFHKVLN